MKAIGSTDFNFKGQTSKTVGKVRDTYVINNETIVAITTDRISAFDSILNTLIPFKGQVLNKLSAFFLKTTKDIVPNWLIEAPHDNVSIGLYCKPYPIEIIVRKYLSGSSWRNYQDGNRKLGNIILENNLYENAMLPKAVITPSTKNNNGHDIEISKEEILKKNLITKKEYEQIEDYALALFTVGEKMAADKGLILADTKYEFGTRSNKIYLIDEIHTPDSSRYFYANMLNCTGEENNLYKLSKEYLRKWLIDNNLENNPKELQKLILPSYLISDISNNYIKLYETITQEKINNNSTDNNNILLNIQQKVNFFIYMQ